MGRAIALRLARDGADCVVMYRRNHERAGEVVGEVERLGRRALALPVELGEPAQVAPAFARVGEAFGRVDIVVANAAATAFKPMLEQKAHNVQRTFAISVESFVAAVQAAVPLMRGRPGRIVAVSGVDSFQAMAGHGVLGAAKAALESLVRALAMELGPLGITVNGVNPGLVETDSAQMYVERGISQAYREAVARVVAQTPVRRAGTGEDVAGLVAYLASDAASFVTGQTIVIDGGLTIVSPLSRLQAGS
ncbi:MAG: SDR family oxidoreductase [Candidatus Rokubacteria bacterium]|nr:SDR family oxidoreductase [Candidatus Rokubacteria bacterium]